MPSVPAAVMPQKTCIVVKIATMSSISHPKQKKLTACIVVNRSNKRIFVTAQLSRRECAGVWFLYG